MKTVFISVYLFFISLAVVAQGDFKTQMTTAKKSYTAGKLEETHFALQQALQELDIIIGKEVLKLMPQKIDTLQSNPREDHVTASVGFVGGTSIHRSYGSRGKAEVEIITNSPLINTVNMFLNSAYGGMMRDENTKVVKIQGYKARLEKQGDNENGKLNYSLQIPFNNALMTFTLNGFDETEALKIANSFPLGDIAKLIQ